jgi:UDP-N-acetylmuramoylalanine--D-glutamate ligase
MPQRNTERNTDSGFSGAKALVMGLGLHGGGLEAARFLARRGAEITVTDLRDAETLAPSIAALDAFVAEAGGTPVRYVLGGHELADFRAADIVIKNPGVRPDSPFLAAARRVETDIALFLRENPARLTAVTGSKGKSFTASAIHFGLKEARTRGGTGGAAFLGGNITVSPLSFLDKLTAADDVVLELSSWQLGDLRAGLLKPRVAVLTAIMPDHLDRYGSMDAYVADKRVIYREQDAADATIALDDEWGRGFLRESAGRGFLYGTGVYGTGLDGASGTGVAGAYLDPGTGVYFALGPVGTMAAGCRAEVVPHDTAAPGIHQKTNLAAAALALLELGLDAGLVRECMGAFPGIEHRLELFLEKGGVRYYNDTAATIPEAAAAAVRAFPSPVIVCGGTDKALDFAVLADALACAKAVVLLAGSGSVKLAALLEKSGVRFAGPFGSVREAAEAAVGTTRAGDSVVLSPGCASFGMFQNEFDRGRKWKDAVRQAAR